MNRFPVDLIRHSARCFLQMALLAGAIAGAFPISALAQEYVPPNRGLPGRREGGGTRGCWTVNQSSTTPTLTALVPDQNFGYTTQPYPSFFIYVPSSYAEQAEVAEFVLSDSQGTPVYSTTFAITADKPVIRLDLPREANVAPLAIGEDYQWSFSLVCNPVDRSADFVVDSWIQRIELGENLAIALQSSPTQRHPHLYAEAGVWYDALSSIADQNSSLDLAMATAQWQTLLNSVGLSSLSRPQPFPLTNSVTDVPTIP